MVGHSGAHSISHWLHPAGSQAMQFTELGSASPPPMTINRRPHALALVWGVALMHPSPPCRPGHEAGSGCIVNARVATAGLKGNFRTHLVTKRVAASHRHIEQSGRRLWQQWWPTQRQRRRLRRRRTAARPSLSAALLAGQAPPAACTAPHMPDICTSAHPRCAEGIHRLLK